MIYHAKRYDAAAVGDRLIEVRCEKCGFEYCYELARIGSGSATAPYGIGRKSAAQSAVDSSRRDLKNRMSAEAELVPCPHCDWINESLIAGYRLGRYRAWSTFAASWALIGTSASLVCAWFVSQGPGADRKSLPFFLVFGPVFFVSSAVAMHLFRTSLRRRIQPNKNYPLPPDLPAGTPPALILNPQDGQYIPAKPDHSRIEAVNPVSVTFQIGRHQIPPCCCECLGPPAPKFTLELPVSPAVSLRIPLCSACAAQIKRHAGRVGLLTIGATLVCGLGVLFAMQLDSTVFWILFGSLILLGLCIGLFASERITRPVRYTIADASRGIVQLRFRNDEYMRRFVLAVADSTALCDK